MKTDRKSVARDVTSFLATNLSGTDITVGISRYGAHLPHIYAMTAARPKPTSLLLSHMTGFFEPGELVAKRLFLLDDTAYEGKGLRAHRERLARHFPNVPIRTGAVVVHEQVLPKMRPDRFRTVLSDIKYIEWKERLAGLVRRQKRPTQRDHPLYYANIPVDSLGQLLALFSDIGVLQPATKLSDESVIRLTLLLRNDELVKLALPANVELDEFSKIRLYATPSEDGFSVTFAPMVFARWCREDPLNPATLAAQGVMASDVLGMLRNSEAADARGLMSYYFLRSSVALHILNEAVRRLAKRLAKPIRFLDPADIDSPVEYIFPNIYRHFYNHALGILRESTETLKADAGLPFSNSSPPRDRLRRTGRLTESEYCQILSWLTGDVDTAAWNGKRWVPARDQRDGKTFVQVRSLLGDSSLASMALDELIDAGLIRAADVQSGNVFERHFLPGGEYNALFISRVRDAFRFQLHTCNSDAIQAEADELWAV